MNAEQQTDKLIQFYMEWNNKINLSAIRSIQETKTKHIEDSLKIFSTNTNLSNTKILDIGSGGGFPGLVIAINQPDCQITMVDSIQKKCTYLKEATTHLNLKNAKIVCSRIEDFKPEEQFDIITARAFAYLPIIFETTFSLLKKGGVFILYKAADTIEEEINDSKEFITKYQLLKQEDFDYTIDNSNRKIITFLKKSEFPDFKPRSFKKLKKLYKRS